ncbi:hypothetical protein BDR07DRAFT_1419809 [Suillus spraguei]|nr:hypothetical protein BDR07DRAFT_1419809 [Suillus spraguei]
MTGVAIASDNLVITPMGLPCDEPVGSLECSTGIEGWNNDNDFAYTCGAQGTIIDCWPCVCQNCCKIVNGQVTNC